MKVKTIKDIQRLQRIFNGSDIFKIAETEEEISLADLAYLYDGQEITVEAVC